MLNLEDNLTLRGDVLIEAVDETGAVTTLVDDKNLIVASGRMALANMLAGISSASITDVAFGDGGTMINNSATAIAVTPDEIKVKQRISATQKVDYLVNLSVVGSLTPKVVASITVPKLPVGFTNGDEKTAGLNGKNISEIALMMSNDRAFSIKRFPAIPKSSAISLIITWTIYL